MLEKYPGTDCIYGRDMLEKLGTLDRIDYEKVGNRWEVVSKQSVSFSRIWYANTVNAIPFFRSLGGRETVTCGYCKLAYLPIKIVSIAPGEKRKAVLQFRFD